jgi:hypothetical protein
MEKQRLLLLFLLCVRIQHARLCSFSFGLIQKKQKIKAGYSPLENYALLFLSQSERSSLKIPDSHWLSSS